MNNDDVIQIAHEAGLHIATDVNWMPIISLKYAEKFAALVAAAEREACAKVCVEQSARWHTDQRDVYVAHECAAAIRERGAP